MKSQKISIILFTIIILTGCVFNGSDNSIEPLESDPLIVGEVTQVEEHDYGISILVEEDRYVSEPGDPGGKKVEFNFMMRHDEIQSEIFIQSADGSLSEYSVEKLDVGQIVKGWGTGAFEDSHPQRGVAQRIVVVSES